MQVILIVFSLFYGITEQTLSISHPYFKMPSFHSFLLKDDLNYSTLFYPDTITGNWKITDSIFLLQKPVLEAMSIKQRDSLSHISLDFISPIVDTFNRIFLSGTLKGTRMSYNTSYSMGYSFRKNYLHVLSLLFRTSQKEYLSLSDLKLDRFSLREETLWRDTLKFLKLSATYGSGNLRLGGFYWKSRKKSCGIKGSFYGNYISSNLYFPLPSPNTIYFNALLKMPHAYLYLTNDLAYDCNRDSSFTYQKALLSIYPNNLEIKLWGYKGISDTVLGGYFHLNPASPIGGGFYLITDLQGEKHTALIITSQNTLYNGELQYSVVLSFKNMRYIYYSVEILLFKNLVIRKIKTENGDFVGIFVRLVN